MMIRKRRRSGEKANRERSIFTSFYFSFFISVKYDMHAVWVLNLNAMVFSQSSNASRDSK